MQEYKDVQSTLRPEKVVYGVSSVDVNTNIREIEMVQESMNEQGEPTTETYLMYQYDVERYDLAEYESLLTTKKTNKIKETKAILETYLLNNPLEFNGELYTVTQDKQTQLLGTLSMYKQVQEMNAVLPDDQKIPFQLTWNSTGQPCREYSYEELSQLLTSIFAYVKRVVTEQQYIEAYINQCENEAQLNAVVVDYINCPYITKLGK